MQSDSALPRPQYVMRMGAGKPAGAEQLQCVVTKGALAAHAAPPSMPWQLMLTSGRTQLKADMNLASLVGAVPQDRPCPVPPMVMLCLALT